MSSIFSNFTLHTFKFYHIFIYTFTSMFCLPPCSSVSSTNTSTALPLLKFWVLNFSIRFFFFSYTGTFIHFISFHFFFPFEVFWFTECKFVLVLRPIFFFKHKLHTGRILNFGWYLPKHPEILEIDRNDPKKISKWNRVGYCSGLFTGIVFSSRNGMKLITLNQT